MNPRSQCLKIVIPAYRWHTQTFINMLNGLSDDDALKRIEGRTNHIAWIMGNLVNCRYWLANVLGIEEKDPHENLFKDAKALDVNATYPMPQELQNNWHHISKILYERLLNISSEELAEPFEMGMNTDFMKENKLNMIGMAMDRCSYLFGQLALMRRAIANKGTSYDVDKDLTY